MRSKIIIVEPFFGRFPPWNGLFMATLSRNPQLTWLRLTDQHVTGDVPKNLITVRMELEELNDLCKKKLGFDPRLRRGYKCCDLRPAFGKLFEEYLQGYDYWGYGDSDILLGRFDGFFDDAILHAYDAFSSCRSNMNGQFALFRNAGEYAHPYSFIGDFAQRLQEPELQYCEELLLDNALAKTGCRVLRRQLQIHDVDNTEWKDRALRIASDEGEDPSQFFWKVGDACWRDGRVFHIESGTEAMFFHFHHWKKGWNLAAYPYWPDRLSAIYARRVELAVKVGPKSGAAQVLCDLRYRWPYRMARPAVRIGKSVSYRLRRAIG